jgi:hypothetical protein
MSVTVSGRKARGKSSENVMSRSGTVSIKLASHVVNLSPPYSLSQWQLLRPGWYEDCKIACVQNWVNSK